MKSEVDGEDDGDYCGGKLLVRVIDPSKPRTLDNVRTLCGHHFGIVSVERFRERVGLAAYRLHKKSQGRQYGIYMGLLQKMDQIYRRPYT